MRRHSCTGCRRRPSTGVGLLLGREAFASDFERPAPPSGRPSHCSELMGANAPWSEVLASGHRDCLTVTLTVACRLQIMESLQGNACRRLLDRRHPTNKPSNGIQKRPETLAIATVPAFFLSDVVRRGMHCDRCCASLARRGGSRRNDWMARATDRCSTAIFALLIPGVQGCLAGVSGIAGKALRRMKLCGMFSYRIDLLAGIHRVDVGGGQSLGRFAHSGGSWRVDVQSPYSLSDDRVARVRAG